MNRLAVIPSEPIKLYLDHGLEHDWLRDYYNPGNIFDEVYLLSPLEDDNKDLLGMRSIKTEGRHLRKMILRLGIDVVRAYGGSWACDMACKNKVSGVPVVVSVHDSSLRKLHDSIRSADVVLSMSGVVKKMALTKFKDPDMAWILPNRVCFNRMGPVPVTQGADLDRGYPFKYRIIHVGRKTEAKNLDNVIKALKFLGEDYCLVAIGNGKIDEYVRAAKDSGVQARCFFKNAVAHSDLPRYYSWADCMCNPSRWEGFGIVFIEALARRCVVVTSDIPPMNEYIKHMFNGLLVKDHQDPRALAEMIKTACCNEQIRKTIKINSRESVLDFEKNRIDILESNYYRNILRMKHEGKFGVGLPVRFAWAVKDLAKNLRYALPKAEVTQ